MKKTLLRLLTLGFITLFPFFSPKISHSKINFGALGVSSHFIDKLAGSIPGNSPHLRASFYIPYGERLIFGFWGSRDLGNDEIDNKGFNEWDLTAHYLTSFNNTQIYFDVGFERWNFTGGAAASIIAGMQYNNPYIVRLRLIEAFIKGEEGVGDIVNLEVSPTKINLKKNLVFSPSFSTSYVNNVFGKKGITNVNANGSFIYDIRKNISLITTFGRQFGFYNNPSKTFLEAEISGKF